MRKPGTSLDKSEQARDAKLKYNGESELIIEKTIILKLTDADDDEDSEDGVDCTTLAILKGRVERDSISIIEIGVLSEDSKANCRSYFMRLLSDLNKYANVEDLNIIFDSVFKFRWL